MSTAQPHFGRTWEYRVLDRAGEIVTMAEFGDDQEAARWLRECHAADSGASTVQRHSRTDGWLTIDSLNWKG